MKRFLVILLSLMPLLLSSCYHPHKKSQQKDREFSNKEIIYLILQNTQEYAIHNMMGHDGNKVYIHPVMDYEVVLDKNGEILKNHFNSGSYNFYSPTKQPLKHFQLDIEPWIKYGNYPQDPTTIEIRSSYYAIDLMDGILKTLDQKLHSKLGELPDNLCCDKVLNKFESIFTNTAPQPVFYYFHNDQKISKKEIQTISQSLQKILKAEYAK